MKKEAEEKLKAEELRRARAAVSSPTGSNPSQRALYPTY